MKPLKNRILCTLTEPDKITEGGIALPENAVNAEMITEATVTATGPDVKDVKPGDTIIVETYTAEPTPYGHLVRENEVLAILTK